MRSIHGFFQSLNSFDGLVVVVVVNVVVVVCQVVLIGGQRSI